MSGQLSPDVLPTLPKLFLAHLNGQVVEAQTSAKKFDQLIPICDDLNAAKTLVKEPVA
jgi:hypothetical protein